MNANFRFLAPIALATCLFASCQSGEPSIRTGGPEVVDFRALPFELSDVKLLDGPFLRATELNVNSLLNYEPDRFLARFREDVGLQPRAEQYHGWEAQSLAGHSLGHYLSACALMFQTTGDEEFLRRVNYIVDELALCQEADGDGYIGAFSRGRIDDQDIGMLQTGEDATVRGKWVFENEISEGVIVAAPFSLNGIWAPYYTQHKVLAGLRDAYLLCGNEKALEVKTAFANWLYGVLAHLPHETIQEMLLCEYGGINETFADLYGFTGDPRHLELSRIFHDDVVMDPLVEGLDQLQGYHANTQIPKISGLARRYELTGNEEDRSAAEFFWRTVVDNHTYVTGGNCHEEYFGEPGQLRDRLGPNTTETCNVYNMLRLTNHLFQWEADAELADYYERALLNHIHASQHPEDGRVIYNLNIDMGGQKQFQNPHGFTCCVGSGMESHSKYGGSIYFHNDNELFVTQFIASELNWKDRDIIFRQLTAYPEEEGTRFEIQTLDPKAFTLQIRYPHWAENGFEIIINGSVHAFTESPGHFVPVKRTWNDGDVVEVRMPFQVRLETMPDDRDRVAIFNGPVLLAGDLGPQNDPAVTEPFYVPVIQSEDRHPSDWVESLAGPGRFRLQAGYPRNVDLQPFYSIYDRRYTVFWDLMTQSQLDEKKAALQQQEEMQKRLDLMATDQVMPGARETEIQDRVQGQGTSIRRYKERFCREAERGGWFSYR
ncbi:MAG: glycoside hydrolase family 127 protein, partial [Bacteroidales bacterium]